MRRGRLKTSRLEQSPGEKRSAEFGMSSRLVDDPVCSDQSDPRKAWSSAVVTTLWLPFLES